jgi:hypothetical protein
MLPSSAAAYELNPLKDRNAGGRSAPPWLKKFDSVHEDLTYAAVACARAIEAGVAGPASPTCSPAVRERSQDEPGNVRDPLIVGLWWNDDPDHYGYANQLIPGAIRYLEMKEVAHRARRSTSAANDPRAKRLLYRSHYTDLQFLHAMATQESEPPAVTQQKIIDWMSFAYQVATGHIRPETQLATLDHPVARLFSNRPAMTVDTLFKPRRKMAHLPVSDLALGSMLHLVQDSYSAGHTRRVPARNGSCSRGGVARFYTYLRQISARHLEHDSRQALRASMVGVRAVTQNPVEASARIILLTRARADWESVVEPYLRKNLFCLDTGAEISGPGPFMPARERAYELARNGDCGRREELAGIRGRLVDQGFPQTGPAGIDRIFASRKHSDRLATLCSARATNKPELRSGM